jgi:hypothetical protein
MFESHRDVILPMRDDPLVIRKVVEVAKEKRTKVAAHIHLEYHLAGLE